MTSSRYYVARLAQAFGYFRKSQRMADAASEMHLLREAEAQLGMAIWENVENIEELSVEYWNLRKFMKEREIISEKIIQCQARLDTAHQERATLLTSAPEIHQELIDERVALLTLGERLAWERDELVAKARGIRRSHEGMMMKLAVLAEESTGAESEKEEIKQVKSQIEQFKVTFAELKQERVRVGELLAENDVKIDLVDAKLEEKKMDRRVHASEAFMVIGDGNKTISLLRAESALLETQMRQLYAEIGRHVSRNVNRHPACAAAASSHQGLVDVMRALRRSIALNHRLAGTA
jgi:chromosome segregation ATPase